MITKDDISSDDDKDQRENAEMETNNDVFIDSDENVADGSTYVWTCTSDMLKLRLKKPT